MEIMDTVAAITVTAGAAMAMDMDMDMDMTSTLVITIRNRMEHRSISGEWKQRYFSRFYSNPSLDRPL